jgi:hypothetical protein
MSLTVSASGITFNDLTTLSTSILSTANIANNSITTEKIVPGAVVTADIADGAVTTSKIALGAVTADRINLVTSLSSNGYQIMPGGLIMQWGSTISSAAGDANYTLNFPIPFPTACLRAFASITNSSTTNDDIFGRVISYSTTQITVRSEAAGVNSGTRSVEYLAIGY